VGWGGGGEGDKGRRSGIGGLEIENNKMRVGNCN
jgi:hypothetical protein